MHRLLSLTALACSALLVSEQLSASVIQITLDPSTDKIHPGESLSIDINISGLQSGDVDSLLGAWSLDFVYDPLFTPLLFPPTGFGTELGDPLLGESEAVFDTSETGVISLSLASLLTSAELEARQGGLDSFTLATIGLFAPGTSSFDGPTTSFFIGREPLYDDVFLSDDFGNMVTDVNGDPVVIQRPGIMILVPEPTSLALIFVGLVALLRQPFGATAQ